MKIIRQATMVFQRVLGLVQNDDLDQAEEVIEEAAREFLGLQWDTVEESSAENLIGILSHNDHAGLGQMLMLADLLRAQGIIYAQDEAEDSAYASFLKALQIRLELTLGQGLSNAHLDATIDELTDEHLAEYVLPTPEVQRLLSYYEKTTQYDKAEDIVWELVDDHITDDDMIQTGLEFYERILQKTDSEIKTGGMDRAELQSGFDDLWARMSA